MSGHKELDKHEQRDADLRKALQMRDAMKAADTQGGEVLRAQPELAEGVAMSGHTATPFAPFLPLTVTHNSWQYSTIYDANNNAVCRLDLEDWAVTEDNQDSLEALQEKYAAFIVTACNSHADLVKALEFYATGGGTGTIEGIASGDVDLARASEALTEDCGDIARAALATQTARKVG